VIGVIYEARPHVTINAGALCVKSSNAVLLKGGSEAINCNRLLGKLWQESLVEAGLSAAAVQVISTGDREAVRQLLSLDQLVDLIIPRGGPGLIQAVTEQTRIPVIKHSHGICHVYVDAHADLEKARAISMDSKSHAPAVCNAMETLLLHRDVADEFLPALAEDLRSAGVVLRGCPRACALVSWAERATEEDWGTEYLDLILAIRIVESLDEAVAHIARFGSAHTDAIVSEDADSIRRFAEQVESGVVLINASTMFNDASRLGMGAEIGISSDKIHARGPMGLRELTCQKWVIEGDGHVFGHA
jgi:glutamate-5-semialdehyde dehydrogenase